MITLLINYLKDTFFNNHHLSSEELFVLGLPRSSKWRKLREEFLKDHPHCAVCGSKENLVPHHIVPFHTDPGLELDVNNLITLCENKTFNCHFFFGHLKNWTRSNPNILNDALYWRPRLSNEKL
jgi:hypothetical protein